MAAFSDIAEQPCFMPWLTTEKSRLLRFGSGKAPPQAAAEPVQELASQQFVVRGMMPEEE
jgi:hypothetical protein